MLELHLQSQVSLTNAVFRPNILTQLGVETMFARSGQGCERFRLDECCQTSSSCQTVKQYDEKVHCQTVCQLGRSTSPFGPADAGPGQGIEGKQIRPRRARKKATCPEATQSKRVPHAAALVLGAGVGGLWAKPAWCLGKRFELSES